MTLILQIDEGVTWAMQLNVILLARDAGIPDVLLATLPGARPAWPRARPNDRRRR